jgi:hypothetical protein
MSGVRVVLPVHVDGVFVVVDGDTDVLAGGGFDAEGRPTAAREQVDDESGLPGDGDLVGGAPVHALALSAQSTETMQATAIPMAGTKRSALAAAMETSPAMVAVE